jgi:protein O-GlcNAc transferase
MIRSGMPTQNSLADLVSQTMAALAADDVAAALQLIGAVQAEQPDSALAYHLVGLASLRLNEPGKAVEALEQAHRLAPSAREHAEILSVLYSKLGRITDSLYYKKLVLAATETTGFPDLAPSWVGSFDQAFFSIEERPLLRDAEKCAATGDYAGAADWFRKESEANPSSAEAWRGLALMHLLSDRPFDGLQAMNRLRALDWNSTADLALHGELSALAGQFEPAMALHLRAARHNPEDANLAWQAVRTIARRPGYPRAALDDALSAWGLRFRPPGERPAPAGAAELAQRHLRLGILSTSWANGGGLDLIIPVIEQLDRRRVRLTVYASGLVRSPLARRARARSDQWQDLSDLDDETAGLIIRNDALDLLIDLDGPTRSTRPALFAGGPAGITLSLYGAPAAAAALGCDGAIGDDLAYPEGTRRAIRVPGGLASLPNDLPAIERKPAHAGSCIFGTIAARWQIGPATIAAWADILAALPGSKLVLDLALLGGPLAAADFQHQVQAHLSADRVLLKTEASPLAGYLQEIDILLDPLDNPHPDEIVAGIAAGFPAVTCLSATPRAALLASWLERLGLGELVAADASDYIAKAIELADPAARNDMIAKLSIAIAAERADGGAGPAARLVDILVALAANGMPA